MQNADRGTSSCSDILSTVVGIRIILFVILGCSWNLKLTFQPNFAWIDPTELIDKTMLLATNIRKMTFIKIMTVMLVKPL